MTVGVIVLLTLNLLAMWWFMARLSRCLDRIDNDTMRARIHSEHARDSAGRVMSHLLGYKELDRRYCGDPPYLHTIPENKPPWYRLLREECGIENPETYDWRLENDDGPVVS
jgi:hypothetical protein